MKFKKQKFLYFKGIQSLLCKYRTISLNEPINLVFLQITDGEDCEAFKKVQLLATIE